MRKKKILVMTDSARVYTGFANIGRHVAGYLHDTGRWDVHYLGWFDEGSNESFPLEIAGWYVITHGYIRIRSPDHITQSPTYL